MVTRSFEGKTALITGADGEIGKALISELLSRNISKIYATGIAIDRLKALSFVYPASVVPVILDVTNEASVNAAALLCADTDIVFNNAGVELKSDFIGDSASKKALLEMKINYIGVLNMVNAFVPFLEKKSSAQIVNILSIGSLTMIKRIATYCASKTAAHLLTQSLRPELLKLNIELIGVYPGYVDSTMSEEVLLEKITLEELAKNIANDFEGGLMDIFPDKMGKEIITANPIQLNYFQ